MRLLFFFFFNDTATTEIYTLSLHDALPISCNDPEIKALCLPFRIARLRGASLIQRKRELSGHNDSIAEWRRHFQWDESSRLLRSNASRLPAEQAMCAAAFRLEAALSRAARAKVPYR